VTLKKKKRSGLTVAHSMNRMKTFKDRENDPFMVKKEVPLAENQFVLAVE
jgi:hypothetical protein